MGFHQNKILNIAACLDSVGIAWLCKNYPHQAKEIESCVHPIKVETYCWASYDRGNTCGTVFVVYNERQWPSYYCSPVLYMEVA